MQCAARIPSREVVAITYTLFSARDSVSDLIAYREFLEETGRCVRSAGHSDVR